MSKLTLPQIYLLALRQILRNQSFLMKDKACYSDEGRDCRDKTNKLVLRLEDFLANKEITQLEIGKKWTEVEHT